MCWRVRYTVVNFYSLRNCFGTATFSRSWAWRDMRRFCRSVLLKLYLVHESLGIPFKYRFWFTWFGVQLGTCLSSKLPNEASILGVRELTLSSENLEPSAWNPLDEQMERWGRDGTVRREDRCGSCWDKKDVEDVPLCRVASLPLDLASCWDCYSVTKACPTLCNPVACSRTSFPVLHYLLVFAQTHVHWVSDAIQPSHPMSSPSLPAFNLSQHQSLQMSQFFSIRWPKYWSFSFSISPSIEYSGLISFRMD